MSEFRLCRAGGLGAGGNGVTQECFNQDVLEFDADDARARYAGQMAPGVADPSDYIGSSQTVRCDGPGAELKLEAPQIWSPPGSCCYAGGDCGNSNTSSTQNIRFMLPGGGALVDGKYTLRVRLPSGLSCTQDAPCTLQWTYMTGNSGDSYPEVFRNCADFKLDSNTAGAPRRRRSYVQPATSPPTPAGTPTPATASPATHAPATLAPATSAPATSAPASSGGGGGAGHKCSDSTCTENWGAWASASQSNCESSGGTWCPISLAQTEVGKVKPHRSLRTRGSSMLSDGAELDTHDDPLSEDLSLQDEL